MIAFSLLLVCGMLSAHAFSSRHVPIRMMSLVPKTSTSLRSYIALANTLNETREEMKDWSLEKDWILQDAVPRYTVVSSNSNQKRVTFWNQLKHATSEFEGRSDAELEQRFRTLHKNANLLCGPAPSVLTDWWLDDAKNMMGGTVSNGSTIWFYMQSGGTLENTNQMEVVYSPGGFVEAKDGFIYELGPTTTAAELGGAEQLAVRVSPSFLIESARHARKMLLVAITVSGVLSATLAYGLGNQMASLPLSQSTPQNPHTLTVTVRAQSTQRPEARPEISIQEQRARQELRVLREKRTMTYLQDRIQQDDDRLSLLQKEEARQEGEALAVYR